MVKNPSELPKLLLVVFILCCLFLYKAQLLIITNSCDFVFLQN